MLYDNTCKTCGAIRNKRSEIIGYESNKEKFYWVTGIGIIFFLLGTIAFVLGDSLAAIVVFILAQPWLVMAIALSKWEER